MNVKEIARSLGSTPAERMRVLMKRLRDPQTGCPWDIEQTFATVAPYTIEEAYEVNDAIERGHMSDLKEELGDLQLQVLFHTQMADERGLFNFDIVCDGLVEKMIARHPHVFSDAQERDSETQTAAWEVMKAAERENRSTAHSTEKSSILDGIASALPALMRAEKLQKRAARVGFDWAEPEQIIDKIIEEAGEVTDARKDGEPQERIHEEMGDLLFVVTNLARKLGVDPEHALRDANKKFTRRFHYIEENADKPLADMSLDDMEDLWNAAKKTEY